MTYNESIVKYRNFRIIICADNNIGFRDSSFHSDAFGQENKKKYDMVLLSQNYTSKGFADEIVGEILNNGTNIAKSVEISAVFYNDSGIIGSESSRLDPTTINSGDRSVFTLQLVDEVIKSDPERYEFTIKWQDEYSIKLFCEIDRRKDSG